MKDQEKTGLIKALPVEQLAKIIMRTDANEIIGHAKKMMWSMVQYKELQMQYSCAIKEIQTKFDVLNAEFNVKYKRNPIKSVQSRLKRTESIISKLIKNGIPVTLKNVEEKVHDVAGLRIICPYVDDIYKIADSFLSQDDITLIERKDYIKNPKPNGYRSLHLIVSVPVFLSEQKKETVVEVQIRTVAMDFWASLEHQIKYKKDIPDAKEVCSQLKECADVIAATDEKMLELRKKIELAEDAPDEDDVLFERLSKLDMPI